MERKMDLNDQKMGKKIIRPPPRVNQRINKKIMVEIN